MEMTPPPIFQTAKHPQPAEGPPYNLQGPSVGPPSPVTKASYPPTHNSLQYELPYGTAAPYQNNPYNIHRARVVNERQLPIDLMRMNNINIAPQVRPRISLLNNMPPSNPEYLPAIPRNKIQQGESYQDRDGDCVVMPPSLANCRPTVKMIHLREPKPILHPQIMVETQKEQLKPALACNPHGEAVLPSFPPDIVDLQKYLQKLIEDVYFRSPKEDLLQQISKIDCELSKAETTLLKLKKQVQELEEAACQPNDKEDDEEERLAHQHVDQTLVQKIYLENRRKAQKAHAVLDKLGPKVELPLYNQPCDTSVLQQNKRKHVLFKKRLVVHLRTKYKERKVQEMYLTETYFRLTQEWQGKVKKIESSARRKANNAKYREIFEKVFPELRKQREDQERLKRVGARLKGDVDFENIIENFQEQELEIKNMRSCAVIPPLLLDDRQRQYCYVNSNGRVEDFATEYKERHMLTLWTKEEIQIFKEKFLHHPKNFAVIASYLEHKSSCDCIQYYYRSKKEVNYKLLLRKSRQRTRSSRNSRGKENNADVAGTSAADDMDSIVSSTTEEAKQLQEEQLQSQDQLIIQMVIALI